ncbi:MAG: type II secretion system F family protein [Egibacteraceae bacterium]
MSPVLAGLGLSACVLAGVWGLAMVRATPEGVEHLLDERRRRPQRESLTARVMAWLGERYSARVLGLMTERRRGLIQHRLEAAGGRGRGYSLATYAGRRAAYAVLCAFAGIVLMVLTRQLFLLLALAVLGWLLADLDVAGAARRRQAQIERDLPDFLDVLTVTVSAGLGFRPALARVADSLGGPLGEEVHLALQQMHLGATRRAALAGLRDRNESAALGQLVSALLQAEELGAPLTDALAAIAVDLRQSFSQEARRQAARAAPRMSLIVTLVIVPAVVVLVMAALYTASGIASGVLG